MAAFFRFFSLTYQVANGRLLQVLLTHLPGSQWMDGETIDLDPPVTMTQTQRFDLDLCEGVPDIEPCASFPAFTSPSVPDLDLCSVFSDLQ
jgi:hypothetical protein